MITYRKIDETFAPKVWETENSFPRWFRDASRVWTPDFVSFLDFWNFQSEIYGLFDEGCLAAVVYLEIDLDRVNIHVSVLKRLDHKPIKAFFRSLLKKKATEGVHNCHAWIFEKNLELKQIAEDVGFIKSGLKFYRGFSGKTPIRWIEFVRWQF